jgi:DNA-binding beta-propeller fold protein YncE
MNRIPSCKECNMKIKPIVLLGIALALGTLADAPFAIETAAAQEAARTVMSGLNGPMGVLVTADGSVWVIDMGVGGDEKVSLPNPMTGEMAEYGFGETAQIVRLDSDGTQSTVAKLPSLYVGPGDGAGGARLAVLDGTVYATIGALSADPLPMMASVVRIEDGRAVELTNAWAFESSQNPDGLHLESNPYAIAVGPHRGLWVTDAAGNALLKIDPATGQIEVAAVFKGVPSPIPHPSRGGAMETDPVPTGVAFDEDGNTYVSLLPGFPFVPGSGKVVRVASDGEVTDYATGLTMLTDLRAGPDGYLYAVSIGRFTEQGPVPNTGAVIRVREGTDSEEVLSGLLFPTSVDFNSAGDAYVTINGIGEPGTGQVVVYEGLAPKSDTGH